MPFWASSRSDLKNLFHDNWREPETGFIEQQQFRATHQRPRNRQHLLFAAGHGHRPLSASLFQAGKQIKHGLQILCRVFIADGNGAHQQVLLDGHIRKHPPPFRRLGNARCRHKVRGFAADIFAAK